MFQYIRACIFFMFEVKFIDNMSFSKRKFQLPDIVLPSQDRKFSKNINDITTNFLVMFSYFAGQQGRGVESLYSKSNITKSSRYIGLKFRRIFNKNLISSKY